MQPRIRVQALPRTAELHEGEPRRDLAHTGVLVRDTNGAGFRDTLDDPHFLAPADLPPGDARAWEEKIAELLSETLIPGGGPFQLVQSIELRGSRPDTELIIRYVDTREYCERAVRYWLWRDTGLVSPAGMLDSPASLTSVIFSRWADGQLEPLDPGTKSS